MKKSVAKEWVKTLRSGKYKQGKGKLRHAGRYCCLGVLCEIAVKEGVTDRCSKGYVGTSNIYYNMTLPPAVITWGEIASSTEPLGQPGVNLLAVMNDTYELSFSVIADVIEKHWKKL